MALRETIPRNTFHHYPAQAEDELETAFAIVNAPLLRLGMYWLIESN
jgi:hypothetical protein